MTVLRRFPSATKEGLSVKTRANAASIGRYVGGFLDRHLKARTAIAAAAACRLRAPKLRPIAQPGRRQAPGARRVHGHTT